ncbi:MAG TPA: 30S ribosomal protein S7 [Candidatus Magasanikbacteria bacterium]|nr:30S ribosomal protein S7 [Candidatus Magasanikbacteria bacterium]
MRGKQAPKREILPDLKYNNLVISKFINCIMYKGKKTVAQKVVYSALDQIAAKTKKDAVEVFEEAIRNIGPTVETKSRRVGGANYQVPMPVRGERKNALAFRWIIDAARKVKGKSMAERLATELIAASENQGEAIKKKMDVVRMAEANKAFAHFAR